jgi:hypothetical protein
MSDPGLISNDKMRFRRSSAQIDLFGFGTIFSYTNSIQY